MTEHLLRVIIIILLLFSIASASEGITRMGGKEQKEWKPDGNQACLPGVIGLIYIGKITSYQLSITAWRS